MNRIDSFFESSSRKALIAYLTVGYPSVEATIEVVPELVQAGCDMIELGIPFSDPLADGPVIQRASYEALLRGVTPQQCLSVAAELRHRTDAPLIFMGYYNPLLHYGLEEFCRASNEAGVDGLIIPDLPPDEGSELETIAAGNGLDLIYLLAPTSTGERVRLVTDRARGFIYVVSLKGVTGARDTLPAELESFIAQVREATPKPLCVGFGISTPEQAQRVGSLADGIIIGSRILDIMASSDEPAAAAADFVREIRGSI